MAISFACVCGRNFSVAEQYAGKQSVCPSCKQPIVVPFIEANHPSWHSPASAAPAYVNTPMANVANASAGSTMAVQGNEAQAMPKNVKHSTNTIRLFQLLSRRWVIAAFIPAAIAIGGVLIWFFVHDPMSDADRMLVNLNTRLAQSPSKASGLGIALTKTLQDDLPRDAMFFQTLVPFRDGVDGHSVKEAIGIPKWTQNDKEKINRFLGVSSNADEEWYFAAESHDMKKTIVHVFFTDGKGTHAIVSTEDLAFEILFR